MSTPSFSVTKSTGAFVVPSEPTPSGCTLPLSSMDKFFPPGIFVEMLLVYKQSFDDAPIVIRQALAKALVPYYPVAGRLVMSENGEREVDCTGEGVWFVEAAAGCALQDVDFLEQQPLKIPAKELVSYPANPVGMPVMIQVTNFTCGGFVIGYVYNHIFADGIGMAQFMVAVAEMARCLETLTTQPIWSRELIPVLPKLALAEPPPRGTENLYFDIDISTDRINELKARFKTQTGLIWTTFEILSAVSWQARAKAIHLDPNVDVTIGIAANVRNHFVNTGYYGNCIYHLMVTAAREMLVEASTIEVMNIIRDEKERLPILLDNWRKGKEVRFRSNLIYMIDWTRLGFDGVDFGQGKPDYIAPMHEDHGDVIAYIVRSPSPMKGVRLITRCLLEENFATFRDEIVKAFDN